MPLLERFQRSRPTSQKYQECRRKVCISHLDIINIYIIFIYTSKINPGNSASWGKHSEHVWSFLSSLLKTNITSTEMSCQSEKVPEFNRIKVEQLSCSCICMAESQPKRPHAGNSADLVPSCCATEDCGETGLKFRPYIIFQMRGNAIIHAKHAPC